MKADKKRKDGFYWVLFEGSELVGEYTAEGLGCGCFSECPHWHIPNAEECLLDGRITKLLSRPIPTPDQLQAIPDLLKVAQMAEHLARVEMAGSAPDFELIDLLNAARVAIAKAKGRI